MLSTIVSSAILLLGASQTLAAPQATGTLLPLPQVCVTPSYGPFKLYATPDDGTTNYPVRLKLDYGSSYSSIPANTTMVVDTNSTCTDCGIIPSYWQLKDMQLFAVDTSLPAGIQTVNKDVPDHSELQFITSKKEQPAYPFYCALKGTGGAATKLEVHGTPDKFYMCAFTSRFPPPTNFAVTYDPSTIQPVGVKCTKITLIAQSIGIIPT